MLIVGPAWVGDMIMAQALFMLLKKRMPDVVIDVLAPSWSGSLVERMPEIRRAIVSPIQHGELALGARWRLGRALRAEQYDQAILLPNSFKSAWIPYWTNIPLRTGWCGEWRYGLLNDMRYLDKGKYPMMVQRFMALGVGPEEAIPEPLYPKLQVSARTVQQVLKRKNLDAKDQRILGLCPGAEYGPAKRWPTDYFAAVAKDKVAQGWQVWIFGAQQDQPVAEAIQHACGHLCVDLTGKTTLAEAIDLLSITSAVVSNDSGLMHMSAACERPLVALYGSSSPVFTPPLSDQVKCLSMNLICSPCFQRTCPLKHFRCMKTLEPHLVLEALDELVLA